jgi:hypothetical protein
MRRIAFDCYTRAATAKPIHRWILHRRARQALGFAARIDAYELQSNLMLTENARKTA